MTILTPPGSRIQLHFEVTTDDQAAELNAAYQEIIAGGRTRISAAVEESHEVMERARVGLLVIVKAVGGHLGTGQARRLVQFLAGVYNGHAFPFDLTDLRALDAELAGACIDYLNYDRLAKAEVHTHLPGGGKQMESFIAQQAIRPQLHLSERDEHAARLEALAVRANQDRDALLKQALEELLSGYEAKTFGGLLSSQDSPDGDSRLVHARSLADAVSDPLCGAKDGPWTAQSFDFSRLTCPECRAVLLDP